MGLRLDQKQVCSHRNDAARAAARRGEPYEIELDGLG
jgi:hypothetical protein